MEYLISSKKKYVNERASFKIWRLQSTRSAQIRNVLPFHWCRDFTGFFLLFSSVHKCNSRNFFTYSFTIYFGKRIRIHLLSRKISKAKTTFWLYNFVGSNAFVINTPSLCSTSPIIVLKKTQTQSRNVHLTSFSKYRLMNL